MPYSFRPKSTRESGVLQDPAGQEEFDRVNLRAEATMRSATTDYNAIEIYLRMKISELEGAK